MKAIAALLNHLTPISAAPSTSDPQPIDVERLKTDFPYFCEVVVGAKPGFKFTEAQREVWNALQSRKNDPPRALLLKPRRSQNLAPWKRGE